jgi:signal transduction histidine kinase
MLKEKDSAMPMSLHLQSRSSLLRLLTALEWMLLGIVAIAQILVVLVNAMPILLLANGLGLGIFAALGLLKLNRGISKVIYTIAEFGLVMALGFLGNTPLPAMLFIVLVIRNCVVLEGQSRAAVTGLAFLGCLLLQTYRLFHQSLLFKIPLDKIGAVWIGFFLVFGLVIVFLHLLVDAALKERQGQEQLAAANVRLRQYALRVEELATEQERNRIARDIHDSLGHSLAVFSIHLEAALRLLRSDPAKTEMLLLEIKQLNANTLQEVRQSVTALRSDPLQRRSLPDAITDLTTDFQCSTGILPTFDMQLQHPLPPEMNVAIYRIIQESLTNIRKHAVATEVGIAIVQSLSHLQVMIEDNGKGFNLNQNTTGFGLQGMQERTLALAGQLEILTAPHQGCCIKVIFPI